MADAEETLKEETQAEAEATAAQASLEEMAGQLVPQAAAAEPPNPMVAAAPETCTCRYCKGEFPCSECHQYPSTTNPFRRWACRPCHNTQSTLKRHGISAEELCAGEGLDKYFSQLRREREELKKTDGRLTYARLRAQLKHHLVTERVESFESSTEGEYQPLSYWELKGYDVEKIQAQAARRDNPLLGVTYRVAIDKDKHAEIVKETERKLVEMENQIHQKKKKQLEPAVAAKALQDVGFVPGVPVEVEDSDPGLSQDPEAEAEAEDKPKQKKRKTEEEKEEARENKKTQKRAEKQDRVELAAAAKVLPGLAKVSERLVQVWDKVGEELRPSLDPELETEVKETIEDLKSVQEQAQKRLQAAAKGKAVPTEDSLWTSEKDLNQKIRAGNSAIRSVQKFLREQQPQRAAKAAPKGKAKAKAKGKARAGR